MDENVQNKLQELEERIFALEFAVNRIAAERLFAPATSWLDPIIQEDCNEEQRQLVVELLERVRESLKTASPISYVTFESRLADIVPSHYSQYGLGPNIVHAMKNQPAWRGVYDHFVRTGSPTV